jgi:molybdenum cofactor cytidylyltransferase
VKLSAVVLAAGAGTRLGGVAKALLRGRDGRTFLARIVDTAREVGIACPIVVVGPPFAAEVGSEVDRLGATSVSNPEPARGMASSVAVGFGALGSGAAGDVDAAFLWPVDHPAVLPATLRALQGALAHHDAARPTVDGRGGHPPLIARSLFAGLAACGDAPGGARGVLGAADMIDVAVADPGCVRDVDTARDLEAM